MVVVLMNTMMSNLLARCSVGLMAACAVTMAHGGGGAAQVPAPASKGDDTPMVSRSALWQAVDAQYRGQDVGVTESERRLSAEQRLELREQVRRASPVKVPATQPVELPSR